MKKKKPSTETSELQRKLLIEKTISEIKIIDGLKELSPKNEHNNLMINFMKILIIENNYKKYKKIKND